MSNTFDFTAINNATRGMTPGMKLAIAQGLITQATNTMEHFNNPLSVEAKSLGDALNKFRQGYAVQRMQQTKKE